MKISERPVSKTSSGFGKNVPPLLQRIYLSRGVSSEAELGRQLGELPSPSLLKGIDKAVNLLVSALENQGRILIVGDFDADGATSTALMVLALSAMGAENISYLVPNRFEYGYGLTPEIVQLARERNPDLIVTVDNGVSSIEGVAAARCAGIEVIVTDHHLPGARLPEASAIVNPNQPGCRFPSKSLAGVGVAFYVLSALRAHLRKIGWFDRRSIPQPSMANWLDLVALGTVADVVPLDKLNRILVHQGIKRVQAGYCRPGISALLELASREQSRVVAADFGFAVGPRLNAAGRLDDMTLGIHCLLCEDFREARQYAVELDQLNVDRKLIETGMQQEALRAVDNLHLEEVELPWGICLYDPEWHQGVVGLLASRIRERFHRPVIAFARGVDNVLKGSARSIPGLHIRDVLDAVASRHPELLTKFGGHAMAAGLSLSLDDLDRFCRAFEDEVRRHLTAEDLEEEIAFDGELAAKELNLANAHLLRAAGPWGQHFPEPLFRGIFDIVQCRVLASKHLKLTLSVDGASDNLLDAIAFNVPEHFLGKTASKIEILYRLDANMWRGRESPQLLIERILSFK